MSSSILPSSSSSTFVCRVCSQTAHCNHFGVYSCRACAAFFRRAIINNYVDLKCRSGHGKCKANINGKFVCKKCRTDRCLEAGMKPEKLQYDRDLVSSTSPDFVKKQKYLSRKIPHSMQCFLGRPAFLLSCEPELAGKQKTIINVRYLIDHAYDFFSKNTTIKIQDGMSNLDKLGDALIRSRVSPNSINIEEIGQKETLCFWQHEFMTVANWLTNIDIFQTFPARLKLEILKVIWMIYGRLEKYAKAAEIRKENLKLGTLSDEYTFDMSKVKIDISWFTNYKLDQLTYFIDSADKYFQDHLIDPLTEFQPSIQEITYMITFICFRHASKKMTGISDQLDQIIETLAADLHSYYFNDLKLINYAPRMAKMMKICQIFERDNNDRIERAEIANIFDVFCVEFSHDGVFSGPF